MSITKTLRGDTIIEVLLATTIFSLVSISTMIIMNGNTNGLESNLELTMVRAEVDAQAEAIRFIHDAYISEGDYKMLSDKSYQGNTYSPWYRLWYRLTNKDTGLISTKVQETALDKCSDYYNDGVNGIFNGSYKAYILNTRNISVVKDSNDLYSDSNISKVIIPAGSSLTDLENKFVEPVTYSHIVYTSNEDNLLSDNSVEVSSVQGIWVTTVPENVNSNDPSFYDFHVYACWYGPGQNHPSTIGTILRLYNPAIGGK